MRAIWNNDEASHEGAYARLEPSWSWPKPTQPGGPPVHLGARASRQAFASIARWGHGWLPIEGYGTVIDHIPALRHAFENADRDPAAATISIYSSAGDPATLDHYQLAGIDRVVLALPPSDELIVMRALDAAQHRIRSLVTPAEGTADAARRPLKPLPT